MTKNHKLRAVIRHEFLTIIRQPSFWISLFAIPLIIGFIVLIGVLTDSNKEVDPAKNKLEVALIDSSGLVEPEIAKAYDVQTEQPQKQAELEQAVKAGKLDGLIVYPENIADTKKYQLFADTTDNDAADAIVTEIGRTILQQSLLMPLRSEKLATLALSGGEASMRSYSDGQPTRSFEQYIVPGAFLLLFYMVLIFSVGYALSSVSEEKENRSIEMVLSYVKPQTLILGKLTAIILVTLFQLTIMATMTAIAYGIFLSLGNELPLPFAIADLTFIPIELAIGAGFLVVGFIFFVALMAMIGAIFPSSKEANSFSSVFFILPAAPFWGMQAIIAPDPGLYVQILTYFPLTSPTTTLLRNTVGNLAPHEGLISLLILITTTILTILLAAKAFRLGTLEYTDRIKLRSLLRK